ncbi:hypothetical protein BV898_15619 [Hypsibius exemplaris]|uniref:Uncharacterized protein n=1 Tax=Hypsibius exemplaris TaxID=2072580 RepID=A0A9X6NBG9_HYPEX|nr:hypothetical protein BV898_15619 [Hypsibius exemplaris]
MSSTLKYFLVAVCVLSSRTVLPGSHAILPFNFMNMIYEAWDTSNFIMESTASEAPSPSVSDIITQLSVVGAKLTELSGTIRQLVLQIRTDAAIRDYEIYTAKLSLLLRKAQDYSQHNETYALQVLRGYCVSPDTDPDGILQALYKQIVTDIPNILVTLIENVQEAEVEQLKDTFRSHLTQVALLKSVCFTVAEHSPSRRFVTDAINRTLTTVRKIADQINIYVPLEFSCTDHSTPWQTVGYIDYVEYLADLDDVACPSGALLNSLRLEILEKNRDLLRWVHQAEARYLYRCCSSLNRTGRSCVEKETGLSDGGWMHNLARHQVSCRDQKHRLENHRQLGAFAQGARHRLWG